MAQTLEYNKEVTAVVPVTIPTFDDDLGIIQKLDDEPNDVGGLTAAELKAKFDEGNLTAQQYINNVLIPKVVADDLTEQTRQAAESERVANEIERVSNETNRINAENSRANAEQIRVNAEQGRVNAEDARVAAEQTRVDVNTGIVAQATEQANAAKQSADNAEAFKSAAESSATSAAGSASAASTSATNAAGSASAAANSATAANASKNAAKASEDNAKYWAEQAQGASGGDFATRTEAQNYANTAERNAKSYTDQKIAAIPTPDVSGQINTHNSSSTAHSDIRTAVSNAATAASNAASAATAAQTAANSKMATDFSNASAVLSAAKGGTGVTSLSALATALGIGGSLKMQLVVRTGTETCGASNPTSITFSFATQMVFYVGRIMPSNGIYEAGVSDVSTGTTEKKVITALSTSMLTTSYRSGLGLGTTQSGAALYAKKSSDGKTIYWYSSSPNEGNGRVFQLNDYGYDYYFVGIG